MRPVAKKSLTSILLGCMFDRKKRGQNDIFEKRGHRVSNET